MFHTLFPCHILLILYSCLPRLMLTPSMIMTHCGLICPSVVWGLYGLFPIRYGTAANLSNVKRYSNASCMIPSSGRLRAAKRSRPVYSLITSTSMHYEIWNSISGVFLCLQNSLDPEFPEERGVKGSGHLIQP